MLAHPSALPRLRAFVALLGILAFVAGCAHAVNRTRRIHGFCVGNVYTGAGYLTVGRRTSCAIGFSLALPRGEHTRGLSSLHFRHDWGSHNGLLDDRRGSRAIASVPSVHL